MQDERPRDIFFVKSGFIKGYDINVDGIEQHIWLGAKGDIIPYEWLFSAVDSTPLFYSAFTYLEVYVVNKQELIAFFTSNSDVLLHVAHDLAEKLTALLASPDQLQAMSLAGPDWVRTHFSWKTGLQRLAELMDGIAKSR